MNEEMELLRKENEILKNYIRYLELFARARVSQINHLDSIDAFIKENHEILSIDIKDTRKQYVEQLREALKQEPQDNKQILKYMLIIATQNDKLRVLIEGSNSSNWDRSVANLGFSSGNRGILTSICNTWLKKDITDKQFEVVSNNADRLYYQSILAVLEDYEFAISNIDYIKQLPVEDVHRIKELTDDQKEYILLLKKII